MTRTLPLTGITLGAVLAAPFATAEPASSPLIEEIIVTAQKREERLQDTPVSVTAFTGEAIEKLGFRQSVDITAQTPNFSVGYPNGDTGIPALFIRGVGLNDFGVVNQGPIATYTDQTYIASNAAQIFQLLDVDRVEVLRGPQGTLYGRNATGGAVNFISRKPTDEWDGWARAGYGSYEATQFEGALGGPISDGLAFRAAVLKIDSEGWMENGVNGHDLNGLDELAWRVLVQADPSDNLGLLFNFHGSKSESDSVQYQHLGTLIAGSDLDPDFDQCTSQQIAQLQCVDAFGYSEYAPYDTLPAVPAYDEGNYDYEPQNDTTTWGGSLTAIWDLGEFEITSITAYDDVDDVRPEETDASPNDLITGVLAVDQQTFSQEIRIAQERDSWSWLAGVYYMKDEATDKTGFDLLSGLLKFAADTDQEITSMAVFADAKFELSDNWNLSTGLRYTTEDNEQDVLIYAVPFDPEEEPLVSGSPKEDFDNVSGRAVLDYRASENVLLYGGVTTGFKAGGIQSTLDGIFPYDEEKLISYEAGFKSTLADGRVRFNGSVFYYDYEDLQVFTFIAVGDVGFSLLDNAADARIYGAEFELQFLPVDNLFVNLGLGLLDTEYEDFVNDQGDNSGNEITLSPEVTANGLVQYDVPLGSNGTLTFQGDFNYQDEVFFDSLNNPLLSQDSYWLYNGRVAWSSPDEKWEAAVWGRNLGDEEYLVYAFDLAFLGFHERMLGTPRSFGIEFTYRN